MRYIKKIEIQYFRSIYKIIIKDLNDINVITGKNDVGKSNVLKALNLFFNNCVVKSGDYKFTDNYNLKRLHEVRKDTIKGKQFIQIKITFVRGESYPKTLPEVFTVTKKWNRDDYSPQVTDDIENQLLKENKKYTSNSRASLTRFLNSMKYIYVPAIKDAEIFYEMIVRLQEIINTKKLSENRVLEESLNNLYENVVMATNELSYEFKKATSIDSKIATPQKPEELYRTLNIVTKLAEDNIPLESRGDGIRVRYIPSMMNYIAMNSNNKYIWGFEEPENSLEFNLARKMANDFYEEYSKYSQIMVTTHSPAFISLGDYENGTGYRCYKTDLATEIIDFENAEKLEPLEEELGYVHLWQKQFEEYKRIVSENERIKEAIDEVQHKLLDSQKPVVLTEGKTDAQILNIAWEKLYNEENCPFDIKSCNLMEESDGDSLAGCSILKSILVARRYDSNRVIIGLFDNDKAGKEAFKLDKNYNEKEKWKVHKNRKGYAMLLPVISDELKKIANAEKLSIELMFSKEVLKKKIDGKGLEFEDLIDTHRINGVISEEKKIPAFDSDYWFYAKIKDTSKNYFAYSIVPSLDKEDFTNFSILFDTIKEILSDIDN